MFIKAQAVKPIDTEIA